MKKAVLLMSGFFAKAGKMFYSVLFFCFILLITAEKIYATDLLISRIFSPGDSVWAGEPFTIKFEIKNQNVQSALTYAVKVRITDYIGFPAFTLDTTGIPIEPFTTQTMTVNRQITLFNPGSYNLRVLVDYAQEINRLNDTTNMTFICYEKTTEPQADYSFSLDYYKNNIFPFMTFGTMNIKYPPYNNWKFINSFFSTDTTRPSSISWGVKNALLPSKPDTNNFKISVNFDFLPKSYKISDKIYNYTYLTDTPVINMPKPYWKDFKFKVDTLNVSLGIIDTTKFVSSPFTYLSPVPTHAVVKDSVYRGCNIPNIDLDSSHHNPVTDPGYAGDESACAPAAASNSMQWLENINTKINSGLNHRQKLVELSKLMKRPDNTGTDIRSFVQAKLEYINKYKLPIRVKFQIKGQNSNIESPDDIENDAINEGDGKYPKWDWLKKEMKHEEDVELFFEYHVKNGDSDKVYGRHVVTASGVAEGAGAKDVWYKDDGDQENPEGTRETQSKWDSLSNGAVVLDRPDTIGGKIYYTTISSIVSESYDSTVVFKNKGKLQKIWEGFKSFGRWLINDKYIEERSSGPSYMNVVAKKNKLSPPVWIVRNYPLLPKGRDSFRSSFFDLSFADVSSGPLDAIIAHISYSPDVITSSPVPVAKEWFSYLASNGTSISNESSVDQNAGAIPIDVSSNDFPEIKPMEPALKDSAFLSIMKHALDLDAGKFNSNTVIGYSGDEGAGGFSSLSTSLDYLESAYSKINTGKSLREKLYAISSLSKRNENKGTDRNVLIKSALRYIDQAIIPVRIKFQSFREKSGNISSEGSFGHFAINQTPPSGAVDWTWLLSEIKSGRVGTVELGWYDGSGRKHGSWAVVSGILEQKGVMKLRLLFDESPKEAGGIVSSFVTVGITGGKYEYIVEYSEPKIKCVIESYVTLGYDPSVVFTSVDDNAIYRNDLMDVHPSPAPSGSEITIEAGIPADGYAELSVFDLLGNKIADIFRGDLTKGMSTFKFKPDGNLVPGVYFITLDGKGYICKGKMIIN